VALVTRRRKIPPGRQRSAVIEPNALGRALLRTDEYSVYKGRGLLII
jgi:hypothetical protein